MRYGLPHVVAVGPAGACPFIRSGHAPPGAHESLIWSRYALVSRPSPDHGAPHVGPQGTTGCHGRRARRSEVRRSARPQAVHPSTPRTGASRRSLLPWQQPTRRGDAMVDSSAEPGTEPAAAAPTGSPAERRGEELLALIEARPSVTIAQAAEQMGMSATGLRRTVNQLRDQGRVSRRGTGWHLTKQTDDGRRRRRS